MPIPNQLGHGLGFGSSVAGLLSTPAGAVGFPEERLEGVIAYRGSWEIANDDGTQFQVMGQIRDMKPGGDSIYWNARTQSSSGTCFSPGNQYIAGSCTNDFYDKDSIRGIDSHVGEWRASDGVAAVDINSRIHRVNIRGCENLRFRPDPCSTYTISPSTHELG